MNRSRVMAGVVSAAPLVLLALLFTVDGAFARQGTVTTRAGQTLTGDIEEKEGNVIVSVRGIKTIFPRSDVVSIDYGTNFEKEYAERHARLGEQDAAGRVDLARWAFDQKQYIKAREALDEALSIDPNNADAATMMITVRNQLRLERDKVQGRSASAPATGRAVTGPSREGSPEGEESPSAQSPRRLLTPDDINIIRQDELQPEDAQIRIQFTNDVRKRYATQKNMTVQQFNSLPLLEQAQRIIQGGDIGFRRDVKIQSDPQALLEYRRVIQPAILSNCATSGCHGGQGAGGLALISPADNDATTYTNFYILQHYRKDRPGGGGVFGGGELRLIDRIHPNDSLLVNYTLPSTMATFDHPQVQGWKPTYRGPQDPGYQRLANWIGRSLKPVDPSYGIEFDIAPPGAASQPASEATSQPTTAPASAPAGPAGNPS